MSTHGRSGSVAIVGITIGGLMVLLVLVLFGLRAIGNSFGGIFWLPSFFLVVFILLGVVILGIYKSSSGLAEVDEPWDDSAARPIYYEEKTPKDAESKTPALSCPDCGYENPGDADFCIRCGRNLE